MSCRIIYSKEFSKKAKKLSKKYRSLKSDLAELFAELRNNPRLGTALKPDLYKIRLAIKSKGKGKSGGARVITYLETKIVDNGEHTDVNLITIYDKSDVSNVSDEYLQQIINELEEE